MPYVGNPLADAFSSREKQDLTGQSGTSFTLTHAVSHANDLSVYINHVRQEPTTAYSVNGTTLTTTGSVASTDDFYIIYDELAVQSISHPTDQALTATSGTFTSGLVGTTATFSGAVSGTTGTFSGAISGTLGTAAQPNITSVGTLTNLRTSDIVGIGQASPTSPNGATAFLHIGDGNEQDTSIVLQDGVEIWEIYQNDSLHFRYDTTDVMTMERLTGNIGLGGVTAPSFTSNNGIHLADNYKIGFGGGGNSRPDFQLGYSSSADRLHLACGFGSDDADVQIDTGGRIGLGSVGGGAISHNIQIKDNAPEIMMEETGSGGSKRISIGVTNGGTPFINAEQSGGIIDINLSGSHTARFYQYGLIVQNQTTSGIIQLKANVSSGVGTPQIEMYRSNVFQGGLEAGVNANANGGGNNMVIKAPQGEVYALDSSGNSSNISPHNFDYIPDGASESGAWCFKSNKLEKEILEQDETKKVIKEKVKSGTFISADMTKVIRQVEKLTGEKLIYKGTLDVDEDGNINKHIDDGSTVKDNIIADLIKRIEVLESK